MFNLVTHLQERQLDADKYPSVHVDEANNTVSFMLHTMTGKFSGFHQYKPLSSKNDRTVKPSEMKYFTHVLKSELGMWGFENFDPTQRTVFLVEGVFDAVALHLLGYNCLAMLSNNPVHTRGWMFANTRYDFVPVCDGDAAGLRLRNCVTSDRVVLMPADLDPGDFAKNNKLEELDDLLKYHTNSHC